MASRDEKAPIELFAPAVREAAGPTVSTRFDDAVLCLAQLIGRQMAREEFERCHGKRVTGTKKREKSSIKSG